MNKQNCTIYFANFNAYGWHLKNYKLNFFNFLKTYIPTM